MTTFDRYDHLPEPIKQALAELEDFIGDLDGKTVGTEASDGEGFIDEGTVDADDAVKAFNVIVAALPAQEWQDISTAIAAEREACAKLAGDTALAWDNTLGGRMIGEEVSKAILARGTLIADHHDEGK